MSSRTGFSAARARQLGFGLSVIVFSALAAGCGSSTGNVVAFGGSAPVPPAMQHPRLQGFPIPPGFALVDKNSYVEKTGDVRNAHCEFVGGLSIADVDRFYRLRMSEAGFTLRNERLDHGEYLLEFESPRESSTVSFRANHRKTVLVITLNPTSGGPVEPFQPKPKAQP